MGTKLERTKRPHSAARDAIGIFLFCQGAAGACWVTRLPTIKETLHLGVGQLGIALIGQPVGLVLGVQATPLLLRRWSSAGVARWGMTAATVAILLPPLAWSLASLGIGLVILGAFMGIGEIATNVQAVAVERAFARPVMPGMHAMYSVGTLAGSLIGSFAARQAVSPFVQSAVAGAGMATIVATAGRRIFGVSDVPPESAVYSSKARRGQPISRQPSWSLTLFAIGSVAFCAFLAEGSVQDWSGVYLRSAKGASLGIAALGVAGFGVGMIIARAAGNRLTARVGRAGMLWRAALLAASGMAVVMAASSPAMAITGYGLLGLGVATVVPIAFSLVGSRAAESPAWALSRVIVLGYAGFFAGPPVIGLIAQGTGLTAALAVPAVLMLAIVPVALYLRGLAEQDSGSPPTGEC